jgi:hypothetical protein
VVVAVVVGLGDGGTVVRLRSLEAGGAVKRMLTSSMGVEGENKVGGGGSGVVFVRQPPGPAVGAVTCCQGACLFGLSPCPFPSAHLSFP